jgi:hypothetical protein
MMKVKKYDAQVGRVKTFHLWQTYGDGGSIPNGGSKIDFLA